MASGVLVNAGGLGDRFVAEPGRPFEPGWVDAEHLFGDGLAAAVHASAAARGTDRPAVAGQLLFEQYALRLAAAVVAAHARDGALLDARPSRIRVLVPDGIPHRIAFAAAPEPADPDPGAVRAAVAASLRRGSEPIVDAVHRHTRAGVRLLRGAMANAIANAYLHLSWPETDRARYVEDAIAVLDQGWSGLARVFAQDVDGVPWMYTDRNTCCLAFRTDGHREPTQRYCLTCPITPRATTMTLFTDATASFRERHG